MKTWRNSLERRGERADHREWLDAAELRPRETAEAHLRRVNAATAGRGFPVMQILEVI